MNENEDTIKESVKQHINGLIAEVSNDYRVLFLYRDIGSIDEYDADSIYNSLSGKEKNDILLVINSGGGEIEPAYFISKCCKEHAKSKFIVSIPRRAKSAATLIALGAAEIHMGTLSELGPIDPQINRLPALGLGSALEYLAGLCKEYPESSDMFAQYLAKTLSLSVLGHFERISESAEHYALRLLENSGNSIRNPKELAHQLVYDYKDDGFVIDKDEATKLFGENIVKVGQTTEYRLGNEVYSFLRRVNLLLSISKNKVFNLIGTPDNLRSVDISNK